MRLFACVWIPEDIRKKISDFNQKVAKLPMKAKLVETGNLHFTVTFLGEVDDKKIDFIKSRLDDSVKNVESFDVKIEGIKVIPNENYIRVLGLSIIDGEKIANLIKSVGEAIGGQYYLEQKITLCRVKKVLDKKIISDFIKTFREANFGGFRVDAVSLVSSRLTRFGPVYENVHVSRLK